MADHGIGQAKRPLLVVEEGLGFAAFSAEVIAQLCEHAPGVLQKVRRLASKGHPIPASRELENEALPTTESIVATAASCEGKLNMQAVLAPHEFVNDESVLLVQWLVKDGEQVEKGDSFVTIETSKATMDIEAPVSGYVRFDIPKGTEVKVGGVLCYVTDNPTDPCPKLLPELRPIRGFTSDRPKSQLSLLPRASAVRPPHF